MNTLPFPPARPRPLATLFCALAAATALVVPGALKGQVPGMINYQGRVAVGTTNFEGTGQFKFALVNAAGTTTFWSNDGSSTGGSQPTAAVSRPVSNGLYAVMLGDTTLPNMTTVPAAVFTNADVRLRVWFNDGANGFQLLTPDQRITSVGYAMVAATVPDGSITAAKLAPGVGGGGGIIPPGSITAAQLAPGAAAGNLSAGGQLGVPAGGMIASYDPAAAALTTAGYVRVTEVLTPDGWTPLADISGGAGVTRPQPRSDATAIWTGAEMIVWGGWDKMSGTPVNTGERFNPATNSWRATPVITGLGVQFDAPEPRHGHTAVWTGTEMIIWGGDSFNSGSRYNPSTNSWNATAITTGNPGNDAPEGRSNHTAVWTGTHMIIWGGDQGGTPVTTGSRYSPATNTWAATNPSSPTPRSYHTAVWTGTQMIVWGGREGLTLHADGGIYTPSANAWSNIPVGTFSARASHTAIWTGTRMLVWGGDAGTGMPPNEYAPVGDGASFNPDTGLWTQLSFTNAPSPRFGHTSVWTGTEMIVWGGSGHTGMELNPLYADGARYKPDTNTWTAIPEAADGPAPRTDHHAVWTGTEMLIAGGQSEELLPESPTMALSDFWHYEPVSGAWTSAQAAGGLTPRQSHTAVWTGAEMIVWGGYYESMQAAIPTMEVLGSGARYNPVTNVWSSIAGRGAPAARYSHTAVWTGTEMIVWGGCNGDPFLGSPLAFSYFNDGGRYNPVTNAWQATAATGAPTARFAHTAVWNGSQMIVWGGGGSSNGPGGPLPILYGDGAKYDPGTNSWTPLSGTGAPSNRRQHTSVWTGSQMLVWGGISETFEPISTGARYNAATNTWSPMASPGTPGMPGINSLDDRWRHTAVWTGTEMIIWGGEGPNGDLNFGRYNPTSDTWIILPAASVLPDPESDQPVSRTAHTAVWTGKQMIVWGGQIDPSGAEMRNDGGSYDPVTSTWTVLPSTARPLARGYHSAVWTGSKMLIFGGSGHPPSVGGPGMAVSLGSLSGYSPSQRLYLYQKP